MRLASAAGATRSGAEKLAPSTDQAAYGWATPSRESSHKATIAPSHSSWSPTDGAGSSSRVIGTDMPGREKRIDAPSTHATQVPVTCGPEFGPLSARRTGAQPLKSADGSDCAPAHHTLASDSIHAIDAFSSCGSRSRSKATTGFAVTGTGRSSAIITTYGGCRPGPHDPIEAHWVQATAMHTAHVAISRRAGLAVCMAIPFTGERHSMNATQQQLEAPAAAMYPMDPEIDRTGQPPTTT
ncbi:MAG: hypothetical protein AB7S36_13580 [Planctomycetota bacterium]